MIAGWPVEAVATPSPTAVATATARADYLAIDLKLNHEYQTLLRRLNPTEKKALIDTQRAWIRFRDLECSFQLIATGPNTFPDAARYECMMDLTNDREWQINRQLLCPGVEGLPCPDSPSRR
jgi:uncharacterized protein YecT (DUF1311 family)